MVLENGFNRKDFRSTAANQWGDTSFATFILKQTLQQSI
jgi:hypothetical protein